MRCQECNGCLRVGEQRKFSTTYECRRCGSVYEWRVVKKEPKVVRPLKDLSFREAIV